MAGSQLKEEADWKLVKSLLITPRNMTISFLSQVGRISSRVHKAIY